jgi:hypothetical protein
MRSPTARLCAVSITILVILSQPPPGFGQAPALVVRVRGVIETTEPSALIVKTPEAITRVAIDEKTGFAAVMPARLEDVTGGTYVGITAGQGSDGGWRASEVHIFPEAMRGLGEGHYAWDFPGTTMTNAVVADVVQRVEGRVLTLTPKGESVQILVPPAAKIVRIEPANHHVAQVGAGTVIVASKADDGRLTALRVFVGQGGLMPPF